MKTSVLRFSGASTTLNANASGSTEPNTYLWSNVATTSRITPNPSSTTSYTLTVTRSTGCSATRSRTVTVFSAINVNNITTNSLSGMFRIQGGQPQSSGGNYSSFAMALFNNPAPRSGAYVVAVTDVSGIFLI